MNDQKPAVDPPGAAVPRPNAASDRTLGPEDTPPDYHLRKSPPESEVLGTAFLIDESELPAAPDGYELDREIGVGGMGTVYRAKEIATGRFVAVKYLTAVLAPHARERFRREVTALTNLNHPNVVRVVGVNLSGPNPYFAMEYAGNGTLSRKVARGGPLPPAKAAELLEAVARGVAAAHALGIVHRDIKPSNILLAEDGKPLIADFGLARTVEGGDTITFSQTVVGSPHYLSPEQAAGTAGVGPPADVYSLGATLFEALTARPPFVGAPDLAFFERIKSEYPQTVRALNPAVPVPLSAIVEKCLRKNPADRYPTAKELADDLARWRAGEPVTARSRGPFARAGRAVARRVTWGSVIAASLLFILGTVAVFQLPAPTKTPADAIRERLKKGETVTLVDENGPVLVPELVQGTGEFAAPAGEKGFWLRTNDSAMVTFLDRTGIDSYRISVELQQHMKLIHAYPERGKNGGSQAYLVGLISGHRRATDAGGSDLNVAAHVEFSEYEAGGKPDPSLSDLRFGDVVAFNRPLKETGIAHSAVMAVPLPRTADSRPWRAFELEIGPGPPVLSGFGRAVTERPDWAASRGDLRRKWADMYGTFTNHDERPPAERSIGVWSLGSWLGVRKLTVTPIQ